MKNNKLTFITSNNNKLEEVQAILPFVQGKDIDLPELQDIDLHAVVESKLHAAIGQCDGPVIVDDTALYLECFACKDGGDGLPGPFIKWFLETVTNQGLAYLAQTCGKTRAHGCTIIGYADGKGATHFFEGSVFGSIVIPQDNPGFGWDHIFVPDGYEHTFSCMGMERKNQISPRALAIRKLKKFLKEVNQ